MKVQVDVLPEDIKTVKILKRKQGRYHNIMITFPREICVRYGLEDRDECVIAFIKKVNNNS